jgi:methionyl aminopeptidase
MIRRRSNDVCWCGSKRKFKKCHGEFLAPTEPLRPGMVAPPRPVPDDIERPWYVREGDTRPDRASVQIIDDPDEFARLQHACRVAAEVRDAVGAEVRPGITTDELDEIAHQAYVDRGAYPSTLHYQHFAKSICTSVNEVVCHGIGDDRPLRAGDIVNVDVTAYIGGMHGDCSATYTVGEASMPVAALVDTTREAMMRGIEAIRTREPLAVIGRAIQPFAYSRGLGVVADYGGHGIGRHFHAAPHIDHVIRPVTHVAVEGMTFTVEPMLTAGTPEHHEWDDGWTVVTNDLLPTAQFEHTVIVRDGRAHILTA